MSKLRKKIGKIVGKKNKRSVDNKMNNPTPRKYWDDQKYLEKTEFKYILWLDRTYQLIETVPGHIVELGVAYGRNAIIFSHLMQMYGHDDVRKYIGFDTFDGYTQNTLDVENHLSSGAWKDISIDAVKNRLKMAGNFTKCEFVKGDLTETLPEYLKKNSGLRAALLYVDCNAYEPSLKGMELMKEFMSPGGVICIDEKQQGGETKALIEFCSDNNLEFKRDKSPFSVPAYTRV